MVRYILGIVTGYISIVVFIFITFTLLYWLLGADGAFTPGTYNVSMTWIIFSLVLGFIGAVIGGYIAVKIAKHFNAGLILAAVVFILGVIMAIPALNMDEEKKNIMRDSSVSNMEAMQKAQQPEFILIINPLLGAIGAIAGAMILRKPVNPEIIS